MFDELNSRAQLAVENAIELTEKYDAPINTGFLLTGIVNLENSSGANILRRLGVTNPQEIEAKIWEKINKISKYNFRGQMDFESNYTRVFSEAKIFRDGTGDELIGTKHLVYPLFRFPRENPGAAYLYGRGITQKDYLKEFRRYIGESKK